MHYYIDGYNLIRGHDSFRGGSLRQERERLIRFLETQRPQGSARNAVTVVFDGRAGVSSPALSRVIRVLYSEDGTADDVIKREVDLSSNTAEVTVVTDDRSIQIWARGAGARVVKGRDFLSKTSRRSAGAESAVNETDDHSLTEELKKLWTSE